MRRSKDSGDTSRRATPVRREDHRQKHKKFDNSGILKMLGGVKHVGFSRVMHREIEHGRNDVRAAKSSEAYVCEFVQENETLTPENTILWQKFTGTAETWPGRPVTDWTVT
jgi:hypothetical protein